MPADGVQNARQRGTKSRSRSSASTGGGAAGDVRDLGRCGCYLPRRGAGPCARRAASADKATFVAGRQAARDVPCLGGCRRLLPDQILAPRIVSVRSTSSASIGVPAERIGCGGQGVVMMAAIWIDKARESPINNAYSRGQITQVQYVVPEGGRSRAMTRTIRAWSRACFRRHLSS